MMEQHQHHRQNDNNSINHNNRESNSRRGREGTANTDRKNDSPPVKQQQPRKQIPRNRDDTTATTTNTKTNTATRTRTANNTYNVQKKKKKKILLLHGNRQTGQLLLGRIERLCKKLSRSSSSLSSHPDDNNHNYKQQYQLEIVAIDAPFLYSTDQNQNNDTISDDAKDNVDTVQQQQQEQVPVRTWWNRSSSSSSTNDTTTTSTAASIHATNHHHHHQSDRGAGNPCYYIGLEQTIQLIQSTWMGGNNNNESNCDDTTTNEFVGIIGFSQGARLVYLLSILHHHHHHHHSTIRQQQQQQPFLPGLQFVIMVAGYDAPIPYNLFHYEHCHTTSSCTTASDDDTDRSNVCIECQQKIQSLYNKVDKDTQISKIANPFLHKMSIPNLHIWGIQDRLVIPKQSHDVTQYYTNPTIHIHEGGHHFPMRANNIQTYIQFIHQHCSSSNRSSSSCNTHPIDINPCVPNPNSLGDINVTPASIDTVGEDIVSSIPIDTVSIEKGNDETIINEIPDDECAMQQRDEVEALEVIYANDFCLLSHVNRQVDMTTGDEVVVEYQYPISYKVNIELSNTNSNNTEQQQQVACNIAVHVVYPIQYPNGVKPILSIVQEGNREGSSCIVPLLSSTICNKCVQVMYEAAATEMEYNTPCIMTCLVTAKEYLDEADILLQDDNGTDRYESTSNDKTKVELIHQHNTESDYEKMNDPIDSNHSANIKASSIERIHECNLQGLEIAEKLVRMRMAGSVSSGNDSNKNDSNNVIDPTGNNKGGSWMFTIGLVGKPSAGKSTFFNTATGFARQRQQTSTDASVTSATASTTTTVGGAAMAPHPFTTISPNVGYCLVPAPDGSCPEDNRTLPSEKGFVVDNIGSTHGRDNVGRRFLPILLKDVAGLVPGAYQGRGRGNQFLSDLCDADVLIHVCDASGLADQEGNIVTVSNDQNSTNIAMRDDTNSASNPLDDMAWIRNELIEWVYTNLIRKWDTIHRKGRIKLEGMFSGYGQPLSMTTMILNAVEKFMMTQLGDADLEQRRFTSPYDQMEEWESGDIYRLVSAFLGVRFPIALALNKADIQSSKVHIDYILKSLPIHGTHVATPLSARSEMEYTRHYIEASNNIGTKSNEDMPRSATLPSGTWNCLQSAIQLYDPIIVFPVVDHQSYAPLPGLFRYATTDPSLPNHGMIECIKAAGGKVPSEWDTNERQYNASKMNGSKKKPTQSNSNHVQLRDAIMMKPGSTIHDVYSTLKRLGALSGEFVRAEAASDLFIPAKPVPKYQVLSKKVRILKIMTNKRQSWQNS